MINQLAKRQITQPLSRAYLCYVWYVDADETYRIVKRPGMDNPYCSDYFAVRTISGRGTLTEVNGKKHEVKENSLGIFRSDDVTRYESCREGWRFYWFRFNHDDWKEKINWVQNLSMNVTELREMERCFTCLSSGLMWECLNAEALFQYLLSDWLIRINTAGVNTISLQEIVSILEKGWNQKLRLDVLAKEAGMCERSFRDAVHRATGMSPKDYMVKRKMETAMELLQTTTRSVSEISADLQYDNPFYFSRAFKKYYGISPGYARNFF